MNGCSFVELVKWSGNGIKEHKRVKGNEDRNCNFIQLNRVCRVEMGGIVTAYYEREKLFHFSEDQKTTIAGSWAFNGGRRPKEECRK